MKKAIFVFCIVLLICSCQKQPKVITTEMPIIEETTVVSDEGIFINDEAFHILDGRFIVIGEGDFYKYAIGSATSLPDVNSTYALKEVTEQFKSQIAIANICKSMQVINANNELFDARIMNIYVLAKYYPSWGELGELDKIEDSNEKAAVIWDTNEKAKNKLFLIVALDEGVENAVLAVNNGGVPIVYLESEYLGDTEVQSICMESDEYKKYIEEISQLENEQEYDKRFTVTKYYNPVDQDEVFYAYLIAGNPNSSEYYSEITFILGKDGDQIRILNEYSPLIGKPMNVFKFSNDVYPDFIYYSPMRGLERHIDSVNRKYKDLEIANYECGA